MKNILLLVSVVIAAAGLTATAASAGHKPEAFELCKTIPFDDLRESCIGVVNRARFYETELISYCATFQYHLNRVYCLDRGRNSNFEVGALDACATLPGDDRRLSCLAQTAHPTVHSIYSPVFDTTQSGNWRFEDACPRIERYLAGVCRNHGYTTYTIYRACDLYRGVWLTQAYCSSVVPDNAPTFRQLRGAMR